MASYFDVIPKELFIIILGKLGKHIFNGITVAYPRYEPIFTNQNFWKQMINNSDIFKLQVTDDGAYFWMNVFEAMYGYYMPNRPVLAEPIGADLVSLYDIKKEYPNYYEIYKDINLYSAGAEHHDVIRWVDVYNLTKICGRRSFKVYYDSRTNLVKSLIAVYPKLAAIIGYTTMYISKALNKDYPGNIEYLMCCILYNYDMYNKIMMILNSSKYVLETTLRVVDNYAPFGGAKLEDTEKARKLIKNDFQYRISLM